MEGLNSSTPSMKRQKHPDLPRADHERIAREYLSGRKTGAMLAKEYGLHRNSVSKIVSRYYQKNSATFAETPVKPIMLIKKIKPLDTAALQSENERLKRQLELAQLTIEGYQIISDILEEEYGIDLLKKAGAGQCQVSGKDTGVSLQTICGLFGYTRQAYYKSLKRNDEEFLEDSRILIHMDDIRRFMPRIGTRKLQYML